MAKLFCYVFQKKLKATLSEYGRENLLSSDDLFDITGITKKGGMSHGREFVIGRPYMYPLFKYHKLNEEQIQAKVIPPTRMVTSGVGGPTYRLGVFLDTLLKPVVLKYCKNEVVKDSTDFLKELRRCEQSGDSSQMNLVGTLDADALYSSICVDIVIRALRDALNTATSYSEDQIEMVIEMAKLCINNSVICYRGVWYRTILGIPT